MQGVGRGTLAAEGGANGRREKTDSKSLFRAPARTKRCAGEQFVRDYLETLDWNKTPPGPLLPPDVVAKTQGKYVEAYRRLTGRAL